MPPIVAVARFLKDSTIYFFEGRVRWIVHLDDLIARGEQSAFRVLKGAKK